MRRRDCVRILATAVALLQLPTRATAQARVHRVGFLSSGSDSRTAAPVLWQAFVDGLREHGWEDGRNLIIERRWAEGRPERLPHLASELVALNVDVIVASAPPAVRAAQQATRTIPIIMTAVADPVEMGFVSSLSNPGGNITGISSRAGPGLLSKLLELTKDALPSAERVGILFNEGNPLNYAAAAAPEILAAAKALRLALVWLPIKTATEIEHAFVSAHQRGVDAVIGIGDPLLFAERPRIHDHAEKHRLPTIWPTREYLSERGLLSNGPSLRDMLRHATVYVDKVLRGENPATIPVEQPRRYELVVNLKAANALGVTIPPTLLFRADEVIE